MLDYAMAALLICHGTITVVANAPYPWEHYQMNIPVRIA